MKADVIPQAFIHDRHTGHMALLLSAPAVILMVLLLLGPIVAVVVIALTDWQLGQTSMTFIGLRNFAELLSDSGFRTSLANTFIYVLIVVPCTVLLGLMIALLIESGKTFRSFYRAIHFLPVMATLAATAAAWEALLHPTIGLANSVLQEFGVTPINWLRDTTTVLPTLAAIGIWNDIGYAVVLFLAGLRSIPQELYDAAEIDGADGIVDRFRTVTWPLLGPTTLFVLVVSCMKAFQVFDTVRVLTRGGPGGASDVLLNTLYVESFEYLNTGYGAAVTVVFLLLIISLTLTQAAVLDKRVHYS